MLLELVCSSLESHQSLVTPNPIFCQIPFSSISLCVRTILVKDAILVCKSGHDISVRWDVILVLSTQCWWLRRWEELLVSLWKWSPPASWHQAISLSCRISSTGTPHSLPTLCSLREESIASVLDTPAECRTHTWSTFMARVHLMNERSWYFCLYVISIVVFQYSLMSR